MQRAGFNPRVRTPRLLECRTMREVRVVLSKSPNTVSVMYYYDVHVVSSKFSRLELGRSPQVSSTLSFSCVLMHTFDLSQESASNGISWSSRAFPSFPIPNPDYSSRPWLEYVQQVATPIGSLKRIVGQKRVRWSKFLSG